MELNNNGGFEYFFGFKNSFLNQELISQILENVFSGFHMTGYNAGSKGMVGYIRHDNNNEYDIGVIKKGNSKIITSYPRYYVDPKIELELHPDKSILRIDHIKHRNLIMETFTAYKDKPQTLINTSIYNEEIVKSLLNHYNKVCRNAALTKEKIQIYGFEPNNTIQMVVNNDMEIYRIYMDTLTQILEATNDQYKDKQKIKNK